MSVYAIGDIQGCYAEFRALLDRLRFDPAVDCLWLVGDLVNRGPDSLAVLRTVKALGDAAVTVLGNHDFHLLTVAHGFRREHRGDTLQAILDAPDRDELVEWVQRRPLVVVEDGFVLVHAGLLPQWSAAKAATLSREVQSALAGPQARDFLAALYGNQPDNWDDALTGFDRLRTVVNACTRLRFCRPDGTMDFREKRGAEFSPKGMKPWYAHAERASADHHVICGHWSTLGLLLEPGVSMLDTGCVWGGSLTAMDRADRTLYQVPSRTPVTPGLGE